LTGLICGLDRAEAAACALKLAAVAELTGRPRRSVGLVLSVT
jgi:hypothetical protein